MCVGLSKSNVFILQIELNSLINAVSHNTYINNNYKYISNT